MRFNPTNQSRDREDESNSNATHILHSELKLKLIGYAKIPKYTATKLCPIRKNNILVIFISFREPINSFAIATPPIPERLNMSNQIDFTRF